MRSVSTLLAIILSTLVLLTLTTSVHAATPTSFCKCINLKTKKSMIIPLDEPSSTTTSRSHRRRNTNSREPRIQRDENDAGGGGDGEEKKQPYKRKTCSDCTKSFCLDLSLPDFKDLDEDGVKTDCFQRDSAKDEAIVFIFMTATIGLLAWALGKPIVEKYWAKGKARRRYSRVGEGSEIDDR